MVTIPQNIAYVQIEQELNKYINNILQSQSLPAYQIETILNTILSNLTPLVAQEYQASLKEYQEAIKQEEQESQNEIMEDQTKSEN